MATRRIVFTKNNYTEEDYRALWEEEAFQYLIIGKEVGEQGTPHLQGYAEFTKCSKWAPLAKKHKMFVEVSRGTQEEAINYCKKGGDYAERGTPKGGSKKGGEATKKLFEDAFELAKTGDILSIPEPLRTRYYATYKKISKDFMVKPESLKVLDNIWIYGEAGTGKTRLADAILPGAYSKNCNKWWDGYQNETGVIINDFGKEHSVLGHHLKLWSEHRPFIAETKGGALHIRPERTIVTSQYSISQIWEDKETKQAIERRYKTLHILGPLTEEDIDRISKQF